MKYLLNISVAFLAVGALSGCSMYSPSNINETPIRVSEELSVTNAVISDIDDAFISSLARHYSKHGGGAMDIVVTYDPKSRSNTAMGATNKAADIVNNLRGYGVSNVRAGILPVNDQGEDSRLVVSYKSFNAHAPKGCDGASMDGLDGNLKGDVADYKLGCAIDTMLARQIAKPEHLLGRGAVKQTSDGRAAVYVADGYSAGSQNKPLKGLSASDD